MRPNYYALHQLLRFYYFLFHCTLHPFSSLFVSPSSGLLPSFFTLKLLVFHVHIFQIIRQTIYNTEKWERLYISYTTKTAHFIFLFIFYLHISPEHPVETFDPKFICVMPKQNPAMHKQPKPPSNIWKFRDQLVQNT